MELGPIPSCSLQELMKRIVNNLYSYDYKSSKLPEILADITRTDVAIILRMLCDLEERKFIQVSWHREDHTMVYLEVMKRDFTKLPTSPYETTDQSADTQAA